MTDQAKARRATLAALAALFVFDDPGVMPREIDPEAVDCPPGKPMTWDEQAKRWRSHERED